MRRAAGSSSAVVWGVPCGALGCLAAVYRPSSQAWRGQPPACTIDAMIRRAFILSGVLPGRCPLPFCRSFSLESSCFRFRLGVRIRPAGLRAADIPLRAATRHLETTFRGSQDDSRGVDYSATRGSTVRGLATWPPSWPPGVASQEDCGALCGAWEECKAWQLGAIEMLRLELLTVQVGIWHSHWHERL